MGRKRPVSKQDADLFRNAVGSVRAVDDDRAPVYRRSRIAHSRPVSGDDFRTHDDDSQADSGPGASIVGGSSDSASDGRSGLGGRWHLCLRLFATTPTWQVCCWEQVVEV